MSETRRYVVFLAGSVLGGILLTIGLVAVQGWRDQQAVKVIEADAHGLVRQALREALDDRDTALAKASITIETLSKAHTLALLRAQQSHDATYTQLAVCGYALRAATQRTLP